MKPFNETDLVAYHLNELSPRRKRALEKALREDPVLASESEAYAKMLLSFKGAIPLDVDEEIVDRNWNRVWSKLPRRPLRPARFHRWFIPVLTGMGLAFAATTFFLTTRRPAPAPSTVSFHRPTEPGGSTPPAASPADTPTTTANPSADQRDSGHQVVHLAIPRKPSPYAQLPSTPPRVIASVPHSSDEVIPSVQFLPLARVPALLPSFVTPPLITVHPAQASDGPGSKTSSKPHSDAIHRERPMDITLAMGGMLIGTRDASSNGSTYSQGATHAVSAIASFHQQLRPAIGYRVTASYARPDFQYNSENGQSQINGSIYEIAGTYVVQGPHHGRVSTGIEGGAGLMTIVPTVETTNSGKNLRAAAIVGVSADFAVSKHFAIQTSYRMQIFKGPDFQSTGGIVPAVTTTLISNEPMVGITYRFSDK